jgi:hypothetical protein
MSLTLKYWDIHYQLLPYVRWRKFLARDGQGEPVNLGGLHWLQVSRTLLYVISHLLMSAIRYPKSTLSPHKYLLVFSADSCLGFDY